MSDGVCDFVAKVHGAGDSIIDRNCCPGSTAFNHVALLRPVAEITIVARTVDRSVGYGLGFFIAAVQRTRHSVINFDNGAGNTIVLGIAKLNTVAEQIIVILIVIGSVDIFEVWSAFVRSTLYAVVVVGTRNNRKALGQVITWAGR